MQHILQASNHQLFVFFSFLREADKKKKEKYRIYLYRWNLFVLKEIEFLNSWSEYELKVILWLTQQFFSVRASDLRVTERGCSGCAVLLLIAGHVFVWSSVYACVHSGGERVRDNDAKKESEGKSNVEGLKRARLCNHCKSSRLRVRPQKQHGQS